ncbi:MAG TPA: ABC transporter substrate-binding protein [Acetobacteraceae bacterium]|jgi:peptide/nickel transport system substrate-binding protein
MHRLTRRSVLGAGLALPFLRNSASAREPGTLIFGLSSYPPSLLPWNNTGTASVSVKLQIYRGLISYDTSGNLRGELAESWKPDGETGWLFTLRDAVFQNGAPVTPEDVKWTIEQVAAEKSTAYLRTEFQRVDRIETPNARTVRIILKSPSAVLPELLASPHMPIIARGTTDPGQTPVGAGPYVLKAQERGVSLDLVAFDKYYRPGLPKTKSLRFVAYADEDLRVAALRSGDIDLIEYVPWQAMKAIEADPKLALQTVRGPFMALSFNGARGPFKDPLIRSAVAFAIKREDIVQAAFYGRGVPLEGLPISTSSPFYDDTRAHYWRYDPAHAKALLAQAGLPNGFTTTLLSTAQYGMHKSTAEIVQQHLAAIGIQVTLNLPDWATRISLGNRGQYEFCVQGTTADSNDPDGLAPLLDGELPPNNARSVGIPTPELHALFAAGRAEFDLAKRKAIYAQLETLALQQCSMVGLAWRDQGYAMAKQVQGFTDLPGALNFFSCLTLEDTAIV